MAKLPWLKLIGWSVLIHIFLVALSFVEVYLYSILINPGQDQSIYELHAQQSAPYISILFGIPFFYFVSRKLAKKASIPVQWIGVSLPIVYMILDAMILLAFQIDWSEHGLVFFISFVTKLGASYLGAKAAQ